MKRTGPALLVNALPHHLKFPSSTNRAVALSPWMWWCKGRVCWTIRCGANSIVSFVPLTLRILFPGNCPMAWMDPWRTSCWKGPARRQETIGASQCWRIFFVFFFNCVIHFRSCQISFCLKMFKGSIHFHFRIVCCQVSPLFIHKLGMLRLELAIDDLVSRALADDEVRKTMESATADGYTGPALQAGRFVHSIYILWLPKMVVTPESRKNPRIIDHFSIETHGFDGFGDSSFEETTIWANKGSASLQRFRVVYHGIRYTSHWPNDQCMMGNVWVVEICHQGWD